MKSKHAITENLRLLPGDCPVRQSDIAHPLAISATGTDATHLLKFYVFWLRGQQPRRYPLREHDTVAHCADVDLVPLRPVADLQQHDAPLLREGAA